MKGRKSLDILSELCNHFGGHKYYITDFDNNIDLKFTEEFRVVIENPYNTENLYIDIMYGEITVFWMMSHEHFYLDWMYQYLIDFLDNFFWMIFLLLI